jgi:hypothetical protein
MNRVLRDRKRVQWHMRRHVQRVQWYLLTCVLMRLLLLHTRKKAKLGLRVSG